MDIWNNYFCIKPASNKRDFIFEVDKAFSLVDEGIFNALVIAKLFDYQIENRAVYTDLIVKPKQQLKAYFARPTYNLFDWEEIELGVDSGLFHFMELFDWSTEKGMACEFVRARLSSSDSIPEWNGYHFLFEYDAVNFYK